jgi:hypothetical protein
LKSQSNQIFIFSFEIKQLFSMLAMSFYRENSLRSIDHCELEGQMNQSIWNNDWENNWEVGMRAPTMANHIPSDIHMPMMHPTNHDVSDNTFSVKAFDWEAPVDLQKPTVDKPAVSESPVRKTSNKKRKFRTNLSSKKSMTPLPLDFEPLPYSILCGQGNEYYNAVGKISEAQIYFMQLRETKY